MDLNLVTLHSLIPSWTSVSTLSGPSLPISPFAQECCSSALFCSAFCDFDIVADTVRLPYSGRSSLTWPLSDPYCPGRSCPVLFCRMGAGSIIAATVCVPSSSSRASVKDVSLGWKCNLGFLVPYFDENEWLLFGVLALLLCDLCFLHLLLIWWLTVVWHPGIVNFSGLLSLLLLVGLLGLSSWMNFIESTVCIPFM